MPLPKITAISTPAFGGLTAYAHSPMKYKCQICEREIDEFVSLTHIKSEEYLMGLIRKDHPEWDKHDKTCEKCIDYYRKLVKEGEI